MNHILDNLPSTSFNDNVPVNRNVLRNVKWFTEHTQCSNGLILIHSPQRDAWIIECNSSLSGVGPHSKSHYTSELYPEELLDKSYHTVRGS